MFNKCVLFLFLLSVVSHVFSATNRRSGSGSVPKMEFRSWRVGRSPMGTDTNSKDQKSFITSTEEVCYFTASVGYDGNQGDNVSPIDPSTVQWTVPVADPSSMALVSSQKNW